MLSEYQKFQIRRWWRKKIRGAVKLWTFLSHFFVTQIYKPIIKNFVLVRRFVISWLVLIIVMLAGLTTQFNQLDSAYKKVSPAAGGVYSEGVVGELNNFNPIYASGDANQAAARLMFSSLYKYDTQGNLVPDIAKDLTVSDDSMIYTVKIRQDVFWHDGNQLDAEDVVFTFQSIQNPQTRSPLVDSWRNIEVSQVDRFTIQFKLPNRFAPFQHSLIAGIIPKRAFEDMQPADIRTANFNQAPIGTGPFKFRGLDIESGQLEMVRNTDYYAKPPFLNHFVLHAFSSTEELKSSFEDGALTGIVDTQSVLEGSSEDYQKFRLPITNSVFAFFRNTSKPLDQKNVRKALVSSVNRQDLVSSLGLNEGISRSPILAEHPGFNKKQTQVELELKKVSAILDNAGWKKGKDGIRTKGGERLSIDLVTQNSGEFPKVSKYLAENWQKIGVETKVTLLSLDDLRGSYISSHNYDVLLFGIAIGADPDVYAYWHSSQAIEGGFNFSEYKSKLADESLEAGRTRLDPELRAAKYQAFVKQWLSDYPSLSLYRTSLNYYQSQNVIGFEPRRIIDPADRFNSVQDWAIKTDRSLRTSPR